ncbi:MAG: sensor histidine kinase [Verrucomicrobia bacterium]|nr:MAG: sensor histidine kinase [Verrucomicrobiota bacterium]
MRIPAFNLTLATGLSLAFAARLAAAESPETNAVLLTTVAQVRALNQAEATKAFAVRLRGVVISESEPRERTMFLADDSGCIYLMATANLFSSFHRADLLEIEGNTDPGQFAPIVKVKTARRVGTGKIPAPRAVTYQQLITGALDGQWVEISGVVRRVLEMEPPSQIRRILIASDGGALPVRGGFSRDVEIQEDAEVRVQAICLYQFNQKRQVLTPVLSVPNGARVRVEKLAPPNPFSAPVRSADSLLQFAADAPTGHRVHVRGVVTHALPGSQVWIRDNGSGLRIQVGQTEDLKAGDVIDVLGFPAYGSYSPLLEDAVFRKTGSGPPPASLTITNVAVAFDHEDDLVETEARLTEIQPVLEGLSLTFEREGTVFKGILKLAKQEPAPVDWLEGSLVRVTGICSLIHDEVRPLWGVWTPQSFQLLLRSPADLTILVRPPWWTPRRVAIALALVTAALLLSVGVIVLVGRRRLKEQAHRREMAEAEFAAILTERNRVAREIHDTLAQGLTATSVQLRLAKKTSELDNERLQHHLDAAQQLVGDSLEEARNSIWNMRSQVLETGDLVSALESILKQMTEGAELQTRFQVTGRARRLSPVIENNVLRVGQEAITNAARHARAKQILVQLDFSEKQFRLIVRDDGAGFDPAQPPRSTGGFGLVGMRERATGLKGELKIESAAGRGTEIQLLLPLTGE